MTTAKHHFFCPDLEGKTLSEEESNHAVRVLRLAENDHITIMNGKGRIILAKIVHAHKKALKFEVIEITDQAQHEFYTHIALAPTKNLDRYFFFIEKAIEIGVDRITPILCKNSERKMINSEKIVKAAISAMKQSGQGFLPQIDELMPINDFIQLDHNDNQCFIAHCENDQTKKELKNAILPQKKVVILIGPEGDFNADEIILAKQNKFEAVSLGESRLRTETAGIVACHTVALI